MKNLKLSNSKLLDKSIHANCKICEWNDQLIKQLEKENKRLWALIEREYAIKNRASMKIVYKKAIDL